MIVCSGLYAFAELPGILRDRTGDQLTALFVRELREGIDDTGIRAGFLKCAVERHGIVVDMPMILEAVAAAQVETGAPLMVHANAQGAVRAARAGDVHRARGGPQAHGHRPRGRLQRPRLPA